MAVVSRVPRGKHVTASPRPRTIPWRFARAAAAARAHCNVALTLSSSPWIVS